MSHKILVLLFAVLVVAVSPQATATMITFNALAGTNGSTFSSETESGFTVSAVSGNWHEAHMFGTTVPDIYANSTSAAVRVTNGGFFTFNAVDLAGAGGNLNPNFTITGYLGVNSVFSFAGMVPLLSFQTILNPYSTQVVDALMITIKQGTVYYSYNVDNINLVTASAPPAIVPEPGTLVLALGGVGGIIRRLRSAKLAG